MAGKGYAERRSEPWRQFVDRPDGQRVRNIYFDPKAKRPQGQADVSDVIMSYGNDDKTTQMVDDLTDIAQELLSKSHAPYSNHPVAAVGITEDGKVVSGVNVESAVYGLGTCAENALLADMYKTDAGKIKNLVIMGPNGNVTPCGRCRQILLENLGPDAVIWSGEEKITTGELLPGAFTGDDLPK